MRPQRMSLWMRQAKHPHSLQPSWKLYSTQGHLSPRVCIWVTAGTSTLNSVHLAEQSLRPQRQAFKTTRRAEAVVQDALNSLETRIKFQTMELHCFTINTVIDLGPYNKFQ